MVITFPVLSLTRPLGGAIPPYEMANAMCRRGHTVHVMHVGLEDQITSLDDVAWMSFEDGIEHVLPGAEPTPFGQLPPGRSFITLAAVDLGLAGLASFLPEADFIAAYDDQLPSRHGLPFVFIQGYRPYASDRDALEDATFRSPCPKICVSSWLVDIGMEKGVRAEELVLVPNGLRHDRYRLLSPIEARSPLVSTAYHDHPQKGPAESLAVLAAVKKRVSEAEAIVFSQKPLSHETEPWMTTVIDPPQEFLVNEIYNRSRVFLCASRYEGFGFPSVEAMACGAALVTTANGGSADYAIDGETALVCERDDVAALAGSVDRLLRDDDLRVKLARQGMEYVREHFDWDRSAERLEACLTEYATDPDRYQNR